MFDSMDFDASVESAQWDVLACATHDCFHDGARGFDCDDVDALPGFADEIEAFIGTKVRETGSSESATDSEEISRCALIPCIRGLWKRITSAGKLALRVMCWKRSIESAMRCCTRFR